MLYFVCVDVGVLGLASFLENKRSVCSLRTPRCLSNYTNSFLINNLKILWNIDVLMMAFVFNAEAGEQVLLAMK